MTTTIIEPETRATTREAGVELLGVEKTYRGPAGPVPAVRGVDFAVARGETVALLGPNGAGKSTTIDMVLGLQRPDAGTVSVLGTTPERAVDGGLVGAMLQAGGLLRGLRVRELLTMLASVYPAPLPVADVLALARIEELAERPTDRLSGGQTQRVRFAMALAGNAELLVLDEPTVGLDVESRQAFWATVRGIAGSGKTVLFATHYLDEADAYADRAVLLSAGRVVADAATTEIKGMIGTRTIRATLPGVSPERLERLPGATRAERRGAAVVITCADSDATIRALLDDFPEARDVEIAGAGLEQAFLALTSDEEGTR
ncbi:MAG TPA: ABC transporter ATP-binding protein [Conexibacter sp.]